MASRSGFEAVRIAFSAGKRRFAFVRSEFIPEVMKLTVNCLTMMLIAFGHQALCQQEAGAAGRPNIILIVADDLGYGDLSCYGQQKFQTPNIDRLAEQGMRFTQYYAGSTVCAPSRSALLTGQDTGHTPIRGNRSVQPEGQWPLPAASFTIAELLKKHGYATGAFGKWGLGYVDSEGAPDKQGFDHFFGYNCQSLAHNYYPGHLWNNAQRVELTANSRDNFVDYAPELIHQQALKFMADNRDKPFFLYYPTTLPHAELLLPEAEMQAFRGKYEPEKPYEGVMPGGENFREGPYGYQATPHAAFAAMVSYLDRKVGELMSSLHELGIGSNTIVIFTSDNGPHLEGGADPDYFDSNGPFRGYKRDLYEGGIRVPFIVRWPGKIAPGSTSGQAVAAWDILPTCAELADIKTPTEIQGLSLARTLLGGKAKQHEYLYWEFHERGGSKALRKGKWKLIGLHTLEPETTTYELYDISRDPGETNDLAASNPKIVAAMRRDMERSRLPARDFPFE